MSRKRTVEKNIQSSHEASKSSRYMQSGLSDKRAKLSSKNFDKLMAERGLSKEDAASLKASNQSGTSMEQLLHKASSQKWIQCKLRDLEVQNRLSQIVAIILVLLSIEILNIRCPRVQTFKKGRRHIKKAMQ